MASVDDRWMTVRDGKKVRTDRWGVGKRYRIRWREHAKASEQSESFDRKLDADRRLVEIQHQLLTGTYIDPTAGRRTTVEEYAEAWHAVKVGRASSLAKHRGVLDNHVIPRFGDRPLASLRRTEIQAWTLDLSKTLAPSTVGGIVHVLGAVLAAAVDDGIIARSPADRITIPARDDADGLRVPLTIDDVERLASSATEGLRAAVLVAAETGLRQGELFGLTTDRVGWLARERHIIVDRQLVSPPRTGPQFGPPKTKRSVRTVSVTQSVVDVLAAHLAEFGAGRDGLLFHTGGEPWSRQRAGHAFRATAAAAEVPASGWHALRHHAASVLIAQGLHVTAVAATLGHSPAECLKTYAHWWPSEGDQVRAAMDRAWSRGPSAGQHAAG